MRPRALAVSLAADVFFSQSHLTQAYCADYWCLFCSAYQQAVYLKHVERKDFACCCYDPCGTGPAPGDMTFCSGAFNGPSGRGGPVTAQPSATHAATTSPFV